MTWIVKLSSGPLFIITKLCTAVCFAAEREGENISIALDSDHHLICSSLHTLFIQSLIDGVSLYLTRLLRFNPALKHMAYLLLLSTLLYWNFWHSYRKKSRMRQYLAGKGEMQARSLRFRRPYWWNGSDPKYCKSSKTGYLLHFQHYLHLSFRLDRIETPLIKRRH